MSIHTLSNKIKAWVGEHRQMLLFIAILGGTAITSFYLGFVAHAESAQAAPVVINCPTAAYIEGVSLADGAPAWSDSQTHSGAFVASKNGKKYYPTGCSGAKKIKEGNTVFFATEAAAAAAGYSLASGCE